MYKQLVLFQLSVLDCFEGYSVRCFFLFKEREKSERDSQATVLLQKPAVTQFCYLFGSKGQSKVRRSPRGKTDYKYAFLLHKHNILLTWDRNTFPSPTLHPPLELCFFSFFFFLMAWHYCYFRAVVYFWIVQIRGGILEQSQNGKRRKNKLKKNKKPKVHKRRRDLSTGRIQFWMSLVHRLEKKKNTMQSRNYFMEMLKRDSIPFHCSSHVITMGINIIVLFFFLCWNVIHMWLHVIQSDSFLSLSFWLYGGHVCYIKKKKKRLIWLNYSNNVKKKCI